MRPRLQKPTSSTGYKSPPLPQDFHWTEIHPPEEAASGSADDGSTPSGGRACVQPWPSLLHHPKLLPHPCHLLPPHSLSKSWQFDLQINTTVSHCPISISLTQTTISHFTWTTGSRCTHPSHKKQEIKELRLVFRDKLKDQDMAGSEKGWALASGGEQCPTANPGRTQLSGRAYQRKVSIREQLVSQGGDAARESPEVSVSEYHKTSPILTCCCSS